MCAQQVLYSFPTTQKLLTLPGLISSQKSVNAHTLPETNSKRPESRPKRPRNTMVFQPFIFRCYVSFREGIWAFVAPWPGTPSVDPVDS